MCIFLALCRTAEDMKGADTYLYDLNHFTLVEEAEEQEGQRPDRWVPSANWASGSGRCH